jgi:hypothetical protein
LRLSFGAARIGSFKPLRIIPMAIHFVACMLIGTMAMGDPGHQATADKPAATAAAGDSQLERAARDYRIQIYETFHKDRAEYDRRQAEAARIQQAWTEAGSNEEEQPKLIRWLDQATACSQSDSIGALPSGPEFTAAKFTAPKITVKTVRNAAASEDDRLDVKPAGSATTTAATLPAMGAVGQQSKPSAVGSLPQSIEAEITQMLKDLSEKPAPATPSKGR